MEPYGSNDVGRQRRDANAGVRRRQAATAIVIFCILTAFMNGIAIRDAVALKPYGTARRVWLAAAEPLAAVAERTRLPRIRQSLEQWLHDE